MKYVTFTNVAILAVAVLAGYGARVYYESHKS
jgi:hypothetical protein